jgi:hypothetical protein
LDPSRWDRKEFDWTNKPFVRDTIRSLFHIPVNFGAVMTRVHNAVESEEGYPGEPLWLADESSPWRSNIFMAVDRDIPGTEMTTLSGRFLTRVFEGPYKNAGKWAKEMAAHVANEGRTLKQMYFFYATCPKCAKHYGENNVVIFARVD